MGSRNPAPPTGLGTSGRRLWKAVTGSYELAEHEARILLEAARTADALESLQVLIDQEGAVVASPHGGTRAHPALVEARQQRITLARLIAALQIPTDAVDVGQSQHRPARGVYSIGGAS